MKIGISLNTTLTQTLTPQQIQYLKLLQLPVVQLEQHLRHEIEQNPMLEEFEDFDDLDDTIPAAPENFNDDFTPISEMVYEEPDNEYASEQAYYENDFDALKTQIDDQGDPFEFYNMIYQDDAEILPAQAAIFEEDDNEPYQIKDVGTLQEDLLLQLSMLELDEEEKLIGQHLIGNLDEDGYLRRDLPDILDEINSNVAEYNFNLQQEAYKKSQEKVTYGNNPARQFAVNSDAKVLLEKAKLIVENRIDPKDKGAYVPGFRFNGMSSDLELMKPVSMEAAEKVLVIIQHLDPPGIGSRNVQECLLAQCRAVIHPSPEQALALEILTKAYDSFIKKHYHVIVKQFGITDEILKTAIEVIRRLNPKPGMGNSSAELNTIIPDFVIHRDEDTDELMITVNDSRMPSLKLNKAYEAMKKEAKANKNFNKDTKAWIRNKFEDAKFLIQAIRQRKNTMLKVMTAIVQLQKDFFMEGASAIKPLIYKNIADDTGLDISTVCRIVNNKYVQTEFGTYELKYFFSEALPNDDGEEISTTVIKQILKEIMDTEPKNKPYSDDTLADLMKEKGYNVARRTVAKYREQMKIPVARLRKEL